MDPYFYIKTPDLDGRRRDSPAGRSSVITKSYPVPMLFTFERAVYVTSNHEDDKRRCSAGALSSTFCWLVGT